MCCVMLHCILWQGVEDATPGGAYIPPPSQIHTEVAEDGAVADSAKAAIPTDGDEDNDSGGYYQPPAGWKFLKPGEKEEASYAEDGDGDDDNEGGGGTVSSTVDGVAGDPTGGLTDGSGGGSDGTKVGEGYGRRVFDPADLDLGFDAREEWAGPRAGFVFRLGAQGLGYYEDRPFTRPQPQQDKGEGVAEER